LTEGHLLDDEWCAMNVLLTGATGHLGFYACRTLAEAGHTVRATDKEFRAESARERRNRRPA
jgi:nucleoside-diphosphate-sugar epimerase